MLQSQAGTHAIHEDHTLDTAPRISCSGPPHHVRHARVLRCHAWWAPLISVILYERRSQKIVLPVGPKTSKSKERRARAATLRAARQTEQPVAAAALPAPLLSVDSAAASAPPASESSMETIGGDGRVPEWKKGKGKKRPSEVAKGGGGDQGEVGTGKQGEGAVGPDQQSRKKKRKV